MRTSSADGSGVSSRSAVAEISIPGVQKPHWTPPCSRKAAWSGLSSSPVREALDRRHVAAFGLEREVRAAVHRLPVEEHHAGAALRVVAALLGAGQADDVADGRQEARPGLELDGVGHAVDGERRLDLHGRAPLAGIGTAVPRARATAISTARRAITSAIARR